MLITQITRQKKNRKRYNVYLDNEFYCGLYDDTIIKYGLCKGDDISEKKINEIVKFDEYIYGKKIALDYLAYRIRTVSEIRKKLKDKDISPESAERIVNHLAELGLTNDEEFAKQLVKEKLTRKPVGKKVLRQKLYEKGIGKELGESVLKSAFNEVDEKELAMYNFRKYFPRLKGIDINTQRKKTFDYLARKGFDFEVIKEIINENIV